MSLAGLTKSVDPSLLEERAAQEQLHRLDAAWAQILCPLLEYIQIGPFTIKLCFSSQNLKASLGAAFEHLRCDFKKPDLTICVWDTFESRISLPPINWTMIDFFGYRGCFISPVYFHHFAGIGALTVLDLKENRAHYIVRQSNTLPWWVGGSPFQVIFHAWLREKGLQLTHAAAVGFEKKAILLAGKGGSGKSTTTLSCVAEGMDFISEDYCLLAADPPRVYNVYQTAKFCQPTLEMFPLLKTKIKNLETAGKEKALIHYLDFFPHQIRPEAKVAAIFSLKIGGSAFPRLEKMDRQEALKDLMMSTLSQLPFHQAQTMKILDEFSQKTATYRLILGRDLKANAQLIKEFLA